MSELASRGKASRRAVMIRVLPALWVLLLGGCFAASSTRAGDDLLLEVRGYMEGVRWWRWEDAAESARAW